MKKFSFMKKGYGGGRRILIVFQKPNVAKVQIAGPTFASF
jgi:hypothetical protein